VHKTGLKKRVGATASSQQRGERMRKQMESDEKRERAYLICGPRREGDIRVFFCAKNPKNTLATAPF